MSAAEPSSGSAGIVRAARPSDASALLAIYGPIVRETAVSFEYEPPSEREMAERVAAVGNKFPWIVLVEGDSIAGYAYATTWRSRAAYRYSVEVTVYVASWAQRRGVARRLYGALFAALLYQGLRTVVAGITLPNAASVALHESLGFQPAGTIPRAGWKHGRWWDLGMWCLALGREAPPSALKAVSDVHAHFGW